MSGPYDTFGNPHLRNGLFAGAGNCRKCRGKGFYRADIGSSLDRMVRCDCVTKEDRMTKPQADVVVKLTSMDAKALRNQLRSIENPPVIVTHVLAVLAQQIAEAEA